MSLNVLTELPKMLFDNGDVMKQFNKDAYSDSFEGYMANFSDAFAVAEEEYNAAEDKEGYLNSIAEAFLSPAKKEYEEINKKAKKDSYVIDHNSIMAIYVIPALNEYKGTFNKALIPVLLDKWNSYFTQYTLKAGSFTEINSGFKRKLCYVTTAVCNSLGKDENCYELSLLKDYRDGFLSNEPDGEALIKEYYNIAPTIVNRINKCSDSHEQYEEIYKTYLSPCIEMIENGQNADCKKMYVNMIRTLQEKYMFNQHFHIVMRRKR